MRWGLKGLLGDILHRHPHAMSRTNSLKGSITSRISQDPSYTLGRANVLGVSMIFEFHQFHLEAPKLGVPEIASLDTQLRIERTRWVKFYPNHPKLLKLSHFPPELFKNY